MGQFGNLIDSEGQDAVLNGVTSWRMAKGIEGPTQAADIGGQNTIETEDLRHRYLQKLACSEVYMPKAQRAPTHQTVVIFDWDDTLLCTSFLNRMAKGESWREAIEERMPLVQRIGDLAKALLEEAMKLGQVFIITNAQDGWVQHSAAKWAPQLLPTLSEVTVVSARAKYEAEYPNEVGEWKVRAFLDVQRQMNARGIANLISLGDSDFELKAAHVMSKELDAALIKTIKFRENPTPEELFKELELVTQQFQRIVQNARCLKISLHKTQRPNSEATAPTAAAAAA